VARLGLLWRRRSPPLPPGLKAALHADEQVQAVASVVDGELLAATRFGLWLCSGNVAVRWNWELVSKARLSGGTLTVVTAEEVGVTQDDIVLLTDLPPREFELTGTSRLTDAVHARVRRSVAASRHLPWPGAGGWVVLRRVPGRDGLTTQVRLDRGASPEASGFLTAVAGTAAELEAELLGT
jgi:hypothetical protein